MLHTATAGPPAPAIPDARPRHTVLFYEDEAYRYDAAAAFLAEALDAGRPAVMVVAPASREGIFAALAARGSGVLGARASGGLVVVDAGETLAGILVDGMPSPERCRAAARDVLEQATRVRAGVPVTLYGEMVNLLWRGGNVAGAIRLEALWDELAAEHDLAILCAYPLSSFGRAEDAEDFRRVCGHHTHVLPTERLRGLKDDERLREISALEQRARALETEVEHRRRLEERLRALAAEAAAAHRAKRELLAVMGHEMRIPLNAIGGYAELLEMEIRGPVTAPQRADLRRIGHAQRQLLRMVEDALHHARLEAGTVDYDLADVPVREAMQAVEGTMAPRARARGIRLAVRAVDPALAVRADAEKLREVLLHLVSNALTFTPDGGRVALHAEARGGEVRIHVSDTGTGIPPDRAEAVFEPFVQLRGDLTGRPEGTGLGLAVSRTLARGMGGALTVESIPGRGSTFTLRLPAALGRAT